MAKDYIEEDPSLSRQEILTRIQEDATDDVSKFSGMPLTGKLVATMHGETMAMIVALAGIMKSILEESEQS